MKVLLILLVLLGLACYYFFYARGGEVKPPEPVAVETPAATEAAAAPAVDNHSFDSVTVLLRQDLNNIPAALDGPGQPPKNAVAIKRKVRPYLTLHPEYQTLTRACDLIIQADAQRTMLQTSCRDEQARAGFDNSLTHDSAPNSAFAHKHVPGDLLASVPADEARKSIHARVENTWIAYRAQAASQVQQLLGSLAGRRL